MSDDAGGGGRSSSGDAPRAEPLSPREPRTAWGLVAPAAAVEAAAPPQTRLRLRRVGADGTADGGVTDASAGAAAGAAVSAPAIAVPP